MLKNVVIRVSGRVQGVFFRVAAKEKALELSLNGLARNEADGAVVVEVEGDAADVDRFVEWGRQGPQMATVRTFEVSEGPWQNYRGFIIR